MSTEIVNILTMLTRYRYKQKVNVKAKITLRALRVFGFTEMTL